jgi:hypothetical protein
MLYWTDVPPPFMTDPVTFTIGITQWFHDLGFTGWSLKFIGVGVGAVAAYLSLFVPDLWAAIAQMATGFTATGGVSFLWTAFNKLKRPTNG